VNNLLIRDVKKFSLQCYEIVEDIDKHQNKFSRNITTIIFILFLILQTCGQRPCVAEDEDL